MDWLALAREWGLPFAMFVTVWWAGSKGWWRWGRECDRAEAGEQFYRDRYLAALELVDRQQTVVERVVEKERKAR